jgi:hypothetical protein
MMLLWPGFLTGAGARNAARGCRAIARASGISPSGSPRKVRNSDHEFSPGSEGSGRSGSRRSCADQHTLVENDMNQDFGGQEYQGRGSRKQSRARRRPPPSLNRSQSDKRAACQTPESQDHEPDQTGSNASARPRGIKHRETEWCEQTCEESNSSEHWDAPGPRHVCFAGARRSAPSPSHR